VAPLRIGRGIQNKVLEAMAMGRAVVASPAALGGLEIAVGAEALQADASQAWQRTILDLLADPARRDELGRAARQRVVADYGWDARMKGLIALCQRMTSDTAAVGAAQAAAGSGATGARGRGAAPATRRP
jgi:glycosyltransferase involved in cell wall biosynthesis